MPAILYLALMLLLGDAICRAFLPPLSRIHRISSAFLVGLLVSSWVTYLVALVLAETGGPMLLGNLVFAAVAIGAVVLWRGRGASSSTEQPIESELFDITLLSAAFLGTTALMTATFDVRDGTFLIGNTVFSDFGPTTAIMQSFALAQNVPTEYPHFAGAPIRYHFLFFFQAGNLQFLGLDPALSLNLLSSASIVAMLAQLIALGRLLFGSNVPGRVGAALFYAHGTLAWVPFVASHGSIGEAVATIASRREFLPSGFPWRGEEWGVWTLTIFANQRHLASALGLLLLVLVFVIARHRTEPNVLETSSEQAPGTAEGGQPTSGRLASVKRRFRDMALDPWMPSFLFAGLLLGGLPLWNGAVFVAAFFVMAVLTVTLPRRHLMVVMAMAAAVVALPQLEFLRPYTGTHAGYPAFYWGYVVDQPTPSNVLWYLAFTFGLKIALATAALPFADRLARRVLLAATSLLVLAFTVQLSVEVLANHKFINVWLVVLNLFVGYAIWIAWHRPWRGLLAARAAVAAAVVAIAIGGVIDLMPFKNGNHVPVAYDTGAVSEWVQENTDPEDTFLTDIVVTHPILLNGRSVYLGWPYYAWSAGYPTGEREALYREMYAPSEDAELLRLLQGEGIDYVVWDDGVRTRGFVERPNEEVYRRSLRVAFSRPQDGMVIYEVPEPVTVRR